MYKSALDKLLEKKYDLKSIMLYGESDFFVSYYSKKIHSCITTCDILSLYYDEYNFESALNYLSQSSLFGDINLLIIKTDKKIPKKELDAIIESTIKNDNSYFIYEYYGDDFKSLVSSFGKNKTDQVRFFKPTINEAMDILRQKANHINLNIESFLLKYLYDIQNSDLGLSVKELEKLAILDDEITTKTIEQLSFNLSSGDINSIIYDILDKKDFKDGLFRILDEGEDEIRFVTTFTSFLVTLLEFHIHARLYAQADSKVILGYTLPKHIEQKYYLYATKININSFHKMIGLLQERELALKQTIKSEKSLFLYTTLSKLQTFF